MKPQSVYNFQEWFEALHTTDQSQVAMMRLEPGRDTGDSAEEHPESDQVLLVVEGAVHGQIADENVLLRKGEFVVIPANTPHRFYNDFDQSVLTFNVYAPPAYPVMPKAESWTSSLYEPAEEFDSNQPGWLKFAATAILSGGAAIVFSKNFLETEKKITHDIDTDYAVADPAFERVMSQLMGPPLVDGNKITVLENGAEFFPCMLDSIRNAKHSITFENFVFTKGEISKAFADALCERAGSGVKVHFLQDAMGCNCIDSAFVKRMAKCGVELEIFRRFNLAHFNHRTHRKLLIIDGRIGFTGGAGISDLWDGHGDKADHWRDTQYEIEGPVVAQMQQAFLDNWMQTRSQVLHGDLYFPELKACGDKKCQMLKSSVSEGADSARLMFLLSIAAARHSIRIVNPYFVPDMLVINLLKKACARGVKVEIIAPSDRIDQRVVRFVGRARWGGLMKAGARFYEFQPALLHSKYFIVDEQWVSVGSCNLDDRSLCLNEEANLNVLDHGFAYQHLDMFERDKAHSKEVTWKLWRNRPISEKIIGHAAGVLRSQM